MGGYSVQAPGYIRGSHDGVQSRTRMITHVTRCLSNPTQPIPKEVLYRTHSLTHHQPGGAPPAQPCVPISALFRRLSVNHTAPELKPGPRRCQKPYQLADTNDASLPWFFHWTSLYWSSAISLQCSVYLLTKSLGSNRSRSRRNRGLSGERSHSSSVNHFEL